MTTILFAVGLAVLWVLAWGSLSFANVLGGLAVAVGLLVLTPDRWSWTGRPRVRPVAIARFAGYVLVKALQSNMSVTRDVLSPHPRIRTGVIAVALPLASDGLVTLIANTMALTPGTMPLEVDRDPDTVLYVHVLDLSDVTASRREIHRLALMAYRAFGSDEAIEALERAQAGAAEARLDAGPGEAP